MSSDDDSLNDDYIDKNKGLENFGDVINGKYVLIKKLGYGTFSIVWLAYLLDTSIKDYERKFYAIKVFHPEDYDNGTDEYEIINKLSITNLPMVKLYENITYTTLNKKQSLCLVFDIMTFSIKNLLCLDKYSKGLPESFVIHVINEVAKSLLILKDNKYLYTDVRPENIMIKTNNDRLDTFCKMFYDLDYDEMWKQQCDNLLKEHKFNLNNKKHKKQFLKIKRKESIKLIKAITNEINTTTDEIDIDDVIISNETQVLLVDFNNARPNKRKNTDYQVQSRNYKAPEIILMQPYTCKMDVWSLGCTMYEMLTSEPLLDPFGTSSYSVDSNHLYRMIELFGQLPQEIAKNTNTNEKFFYSNGNFYVPIEDEDWSIEQSLECDGCESISSFTLTLLKDMLKYNQKERIDFKTIIENIEIFTHSIS